MPTLEEAIRDKSELERTLLSFEMTTDCQMLICYFYPKVGDLNISKIHDNDLRLNSDLIWFFCAIPLTALKPFGAIPDSIILIPISSNEIGHYKVQFPDKLSNYRPASFSSIPAHAKFNNGIRF